MSGLPETVKFVPDGTPCPPVLLTFAVKSAADTPFIWIFSKMSTNEFLF